VRLRAELNPDPTPEPESKDLELTPDSLKKLIKEVLEEQPKPQQPPPAESQDKILEKLSSIEGQLSQLSKSKPEAQDVAEHIKDCPECYKKTWELFNSAKHECLGCGMPLIQDEQALAKAEIACPGCKSDAYTDRRKR
jgi:DNA-binding transcriptional MerR regulator